MIHTHIDNNSDDNGTTMNPKGNSLWNLHLVSCWASHPFLLQFLGYQRALSKGHIGRGTISIYSSHDGDNVYIYIIIIITIIIMMIIIIGSNKMYITNLIWLGWVWKSGDLPASCDKFHDFNGENDHINIIITAFFRWFFYGFLQISTSFFRLGRPTLLGDPLLGDSCAAKQWIVWKILTENHIFHRELPFGFIVVPLSSLLLSIWVWINTY